MMGQLVRWCDGTLNKGKMRQSKGIAAVLILVGLAASVGCVLALAGPIAEGIVAAILLAQRSLVQHLSAVADGLRLSLAEGRRSVAKIVSRNTQDMPSTAVARAAIESGAENLSDGIVAPALWFLIGGLPGLLIYKMVNTADSMIGYRTPQYEAFGWAAARLDDVLNWVPARLTALLIAIPGGVVGQWPHIRQDAALHRSPNAGWPEAAMARALNIALAGPRAYDGKMQDFAWVNIGGRRNIGPIEIDSTVTHMWQAWMTLLACVLGVGLILI